MRAIAPKKLWLAGLVAVGGTAMVVFWVKRAGADGIPTSPTLHYSGTIVENGAPFTGEKTVAVAFWTAAADGTKVCEQIDDRAAVQGGRFRLALDDGCVAAVRANANLWAETRVAGTSFGRRKLGAVPFAVAAERAGVAAAATGGLESRLGSLEQQVGMVQPRVIARSVERTGHIPPGTGTWTTIPGLTVTFTLAQTSLVQVAGNGTQRTTDVNPSTVCQAGYRYVVDGVPRGEDNYGQRLHVSTGANQHSVWTVIDFSALGPGQHTITLQSRNADNGSSCYICAEADGSAAKYDSCTLNVVAIPQ